MAVKYLTKKKNLRSLNVNKSNGSISAPKGLPYSLSVQLQALIAYLEIISKFVSILKC